MRRLVIGGLGVVFTAAALAVPATASADANVPFTLASHAAPGLAVTPVDAGESAPVLLIPRGSGPFQQWQPVYEGDGNYSLRNSSTGYCLSGEGLAGSQVYQTVCEGAPYVMWRVRVDREGNGVRFMAGTDLCLDARDGNVGPGAVLVQNTCSNAPSQIWDAVGYQE